MKQLSVFTDINEPDPFPKKLVALVESGIDFRMDEIENDYWIIRLGLTGQAMAVVHGKQNAIDALWAAAKAAYPAAKCFQEDK